MKNGKRVFLSVAAVFVVMLFGMCSSETTSYSATCTRCLQHARGVEKSIFGITYYRREVFRQSSGGLMSPDAFGPPIAKIDPALYEKITGHACSHVFAREGFCRYRLGSVGCGSFGGAVKYRFRNALIRNNYHAYLRIPDEGLARESYEMIEKLYPLEGSRFMLENPLHAESLPDEPASILLRGLGLVNTATEWRQVLDAARSGNGSLDLLRDPKLIIPRLQHPDPNVRIEAIDRLAAFKDSEAWAAIGGSLNDRQTGKYAAERIVGARYLPLFDAVLKADEKARSRNPLAVDSVEYVPEVFWYHVELLNAEEIRTLLAQQLRRTDRLALTAIRKQDRLEFLDDVLALLNRTRSREALVTVEHLLKGPNPFSPGGQSVDDPWRSMVASANSAAVSGLAAKGQRIYQIQQAVVSLGTKRDPANWMQLGQLRHECISQGGSEWFSGGFAQAMAESDRAKTIALLIEELDGEYPQVRAALTGLALIADPTTLPAVENFRNRSIGAIYQTNAISKKFLDFAIYRCRGVHRWRLVQREGISSIEKPESAAQ